MRHGVPPHSWMFMRGRLWLQYGSSGLSTWAVHGAPHIGHGGHGRRVANLGTLGPRRGYPDPQPAAGGAPSPGVAAGAWSGTTAARGADAGLDGTDAGLEAGSTSVGAISSATSLGGAGRAPRAVSSSLLCFLGGPPSSSAEEPPPIISSNPWVLPSWGISDAASSPKSSGIYGCK